MTMTTRSSISVYLVGPCSSASRKLAVAFGKEEGVSLTERNFIDVIWNKAFSDDRIAARQQVNHELQMQHGFISVGNLIDWAVHNFAEKSTHVESAEKLLRTYFKSENEADRILTRYQQSLVVLVDNTIPARDKETSETDCTITTLQHLKIPFYHMRERDLQIQVNILKRAINNGELPSPLTSLSFYEHLSNKKKKKGHTDNGLEKFFSAVNLPFYLNPNRDIYGSWPEIRSIFISETELRQTFEHPVKGRTNRFLHLRNGSDDLFLVEFDRCIPSPIVKGLLQNGLRIQGCTYSFLGCSSSGLKKRKAFVIKGSSQRALEERQKYGDFSSLKTASKQISRFSLLLTNVVITDVTPSQVKVECDVESNKFCFTDGCGKISSDLAIALARESRKILSRQYEEVSSEPSVFQVRVGGIKGIVVKDSTLSKGTMVVRPSMQKFDTKSFPQISVCDYSRPYSFGNLNKQFITLLSGLGVPDENFISIQKDYFKQIQNMTHNFDHALQILEWHNRSHELIEQDEKNMRECLLKLKSLQTQLICVSPKLKILVPESRTLFGVAETPRFCPKTKHRFPGILKYGECMIRVTMKGGKRVSLQDQRVVVSKNPCYLLGDVRVLKAVSSMQRPELAGLERDLVDCIVFPIEGGTPHSNEIAGSDLDGDQYFVCWDKRLIPPRVDKPYTYPGYESKRVNKNKPTHFDLVQYFSGQNVVSDLTGRVDGNYKAWAAIKGPASDECVRLGQLFSRVVDSAKSGEMVKLEQNLRVPQEQRPSPSPTSKFVWQQMEYFANAFIEEQLRVGNLNGNDFKDDVALTRVHDDHDVDENYEDEEVAEDKNFLFDLVSRNHLAMSEFTKFRLIMQHLNGHIDDFFHSKYVSCVDFALFDQYELGFVVYNHDIPEYVIANSLRYCSRILSNQTTFFAKYVDKDQTPWKFYWRSEAEASMLYFTKILLHALRLNTDALLILKLPDSVSVVLRFSVPFEKAKNTRRSILHDDGNTCIDEPLDDFIDVNSVFISRNFGYVHEYTLRDKKYRMTIEMSGDSLDSLQIYRGEKRATFAHLRIDSLLSIGDLRRVILSIDLTRFDRRMLNGRRRHPLVRKAPVLDMELFVSNRTTPFAKVPNKICLADILVDDEDSWDKSIPQFQEKEKHNMADAVEMQNKMACDILQSINALGALPYSRQVLAEIISSVLYPAHRHFGMLDQINSKLQEELESMSYKIITGVISSNDTDDEGLLHIMSLVSLLSDLGINVSTHNISGGHRAPFQLVHQLVGVIRKWDLWLTVSIAKRVELLNWMKSLVGPVDDHVTSFAYRNVIEQANIFLHELKDGCESIRSSPCVSRLNNLRIEPNKSMFDDDMDSNNKSSKRKTPVITLYSVQAMPIGLRFARGEHVRIFKQPTNIPSEMIESSTGYSALKDYDEEFPVLSKAKTAESKQRTTGTTSKNRCSCLGRVMRVTEAPFSIKIKLIAPSYIDDLSYVPQPIEDCISEKKDIWFELQMVPANVVAHERIIDSIMLTLDPKEHNNLFFDPRISQCIMGAPAVEEVVVKDGFHLSPETNLNSRQQEALKHSISNTLSLVHGPPGTGKTTTIIQIVRNILLSSSDRILVCAETNLAVDNLALRMLDNPKSSTTSGEIIRVGSGDKVDDKLQSIHLEAMVKGKIPNTSSHDADSEQDFYLSKHKKIMNEILSSARVIFATTIGAGDPTLNGQKFGFVIMDEASMSTEPSCLPALSHGCSRLVMVGDHKQLGPHACDSNCVSLFERLLSETEANAIPAAVTMLNQQHRMHSKLCQFPSKQFYDDKLLTATGIDGARLIPQAIFGRKSPIKFVPVKDGKEQRMKSGSWYNEVEIGYILKAVKDLTNQSGEQNLKGENITILTPYRAQQARIQIQLRNAWQQSDPPPEVCSIDGYQGRENEIIVFSAVRCGSSLGFCDDCRRINVLLTRAKRGLVVVGDCTTLMRSRIWREWIQMAEQESTMKAKASS